MTPAEKVLKQINAEVAMMPLHESRAREIAAKIPGWSGTYHMLFFKAVFAALPEIKNVLILGVYQGRDIAFMSAGCARPLNITGVDKFSDTPCEDWPEEKRGLSWEAAGFGPAPTLANAQNNLSGLPPHHIVDLIESEDDKWLSSAVGKWDCIYLDTSHEETTVHRQLAQVRPLCHENTIIAGDDYAPIEPTWGVDAAVKKGFKEHHLLADTIWWADAGAIK